MADNTEKKELTFEEALVRLEEIVRLLESGNVPLDKSLELFEEGSGLVRRCNSQLDGAEQKIKMLVAGQDGNYEAKPFESDKL